MFTCVAPLSAALDQNAAAENFGASVRLAPAASAR